VDPEVSISLYLPVTTHRKITPSCLKAVLDNLLESESQTITKYSVVFITFIPSLVFSIYTK
jgi:hypothetical protein